MKNACAVIIKKTTGKSLFFCVILLLLGSRVLAQAPLISYQTPQTFTTTKTIIPLVPTNTGGSVPAMAYGQVTTFAGSGAQGATNGPAATATFFQPRDATVDLSGNVYITDDNNTIRVIKNGIVSSFAGSGALGLVDGTGLNAQFKNPASLITDKTGNIYAADLNNNAVRKITPAGVVTTIAGNGTRSFVNGNGSNATFNSPCAVAVDANGIIYVGDQFNFCVRKIATDGTVSTFAGNGLYGGNDGTGQQASFSQTSGVATDQAGNIYVADEDNNKIRKITPAGVVNTIAGTGAKGNSDGPAAFATFNTPTDVAVDPAGNIYVADAFNQLIRKINTNGVVSTLAGNGSIGFADGIGNQAIFSSPYGIGINNQGTLYVADNQNNRIRTIATTGYAIDKPLPAGLTFDATTGIISGTPTAASPATNYTVTAYNLSGSSSAMLGITVIADAIQASVITFSQINNPPLDANDDFVPDATSTNTETPITYTSSNPAVATVTADGLIHLVAPGISIITASQAGDANYTAATPVSETLYVTVTEYISFPAISAKTTCDADFNINATSDYGAIPLTYASSNPAVATIDANGLVHIVSAGTALITVSQAGGYYVIAAEPVSRAVTVAPPVTPSVAFQASVNTPVCSGTNISFIAVTVNGGSAPIYQWQVNGQDAGTNSTKFSSSNFADGDVVTCILTDNTDPCVTTRTAFSNSVTVSIIPTPTLVPAVIITPASVDTCTGSVLSFAAAVTNAGSTPTYQWQVNGQNAGDNTGSFSAANLQNGDLVTCTVTSSLTCSVATATSNAVSVTIDPFVYNTVNITSSVADRIIPPGQSVTFTATVADTTGVAYQWQVNGIDAGTNSLYFATNTLNNGDVVSCSVTTSGKCIATPYVVSNTIKIIVITPIVVPNTFTPNGDGVNDTWDIPALTAYPGCIVSIFNRYGALLMQSTNYPKPWDGTYNGSPLPTSTYYYIIDPKNGKQKIAGFVTILR